MISPASYPDRASVDGYLAILDSWGLVGEVADHALDEWGYMAGSDQDRLDDVNAAFRDPGVRALITTRGGAGAYRIAAEVDFNAVRADPKPVVGFSDITYLHLALAKNCGLGSIHGCLVGPTAQATVRQLLMSVEPITLAADPSTVSGAMRCSGGEQRTGEQQDQGEVRGRVIGGNLTSVATSVGVHLPMMEGAILFLEDQRLVGLGTVDRQLTQLISSGALDGLAGIALGSFEGFRGYRDRGWTLANVLNDRLGPLGVPVLGGLYAGHDLTTTTTTTTTDGRPDQTALPLGSMATLSTTKGTLTIDPIVH